MPSTSYTDIETVKLSLDRANDTAIDVRLTSIIASASRQIDQLAGRRFYQVTETRIFDGQFGDWLEIDDIVSVSALRTDISGTRTYDTIWADTDFDLNPNNADSISQPYTAIQPRPFTARWFPTLRNSVQVTGVWGWPSVPPEIVEATIIQSVRIYMRKNQPFGVAGQGDFGRIALLPRVDPDVQALVAPYVRQHIGAI